MNHAVDAALVKRRLKEFGWTREDLAKFARISQRTVYYLLAGQPLEPETIAKVAKALRLAARDVSPATWKSLAAYLEKRSQP